MSEGAEDWAATVRRLLDGDRVAFVRVSRLATHYLIRWRAYDFRDEWDDLVSDVILAIVRAGRSGLPRQSGAAAAYVRSVTRNKFVDRLRRKRFEAGPTERTAEDVDPCWPAALERQREAVEVWEIVRSLPPKQREALEIVYREGRSYQEAARKADVPLGSLKRHLREGVAALQKQFASVPRPDPRTRFEPTSSLSKQGGGRVAAAGDPE